MFQPARDPFLEVVATLLATRGRKVDYETLVDVLASSPAYPSLLAVSEALTRLGLEHDALAIGPENLDGLACPFVAHLRNQSFALVVRVTADVVEMTTDGRAPRSVSRGAFEGTMSGAVLVPQRLVAPTYVPRKKARRVPTRLLVAMSGLLLLAAVLLSWPTTPELTQIGWLGLTHMVGVLLALFLASEELGFSSVAQRLCTVSQKTSCRSVLGSRAAKLGPVSMADLGVSYFAGGTLVCLIALSSGSPHLALFAFRWLSLLALPYTIFSLTYQAFVIRQWCPLCVLVQTVLLGQAGLLYDVPLTPPALVTSELAALLFLFVPGVVWLAVKPLLRKSLAYMGVTLERERLARNPVVIDALLRAAEPEETPEVIFNLAHGETAAPVVVTMYTDLTCGHCKDRHRELVEVLREHPRALRVILRVQGPGDGDARIKQVLATIAHRLASGQAEEAYHLVESWYAERLDAKSLVLPEALSIDAQQLLDKHRALAAHPPFLATPRIFVHGRQWPDGIALSNLRYLLQELDVASAEESAPSRSAEEVTA